MKNWLKNLLLMMVVIIGMVIILEFAAQFLISKKLINPIIFGDSETYMFDAKLGWAIEPNTEGIHNSREFEYPIKNNSFGMRYKEFSKEKNTGTYRVAVLGDSFTWGFMEESKRFTDKAEEFSKNKLEMLNFGVSGYGPIQYYLMLDKIIQYKPDMVLIAFYLGNDFLDNVFWNRYGCYKPYAKIDANGELEITGYPLPNRFGSPGNPRTRLTEIEKNYYIAYRLRLLIGRFGNKTFDKINQKGLLGLEEKDFYLKQSDNIELINNAITINELLLKRIKEKLEMNNIKFAVLEIPSKNEYGYKSWERKPIRGWEKQPVRNNTAGVKDYRVHNALMTTLEKLNID
ncbi:MAG: SGNH/GDSL hydrolase family protein [Sporomusaceae bacterium]|jgi:hypothetical protein|nr:SGNH/GDSL hydrolase family protein [Sporomusaceae bacterium]